MQTNPLPRRRAAVERASSVDSTGAPAAAAPSASDGPVQHSSSGGTWKANTQLSTLIRWTIMLLPSVLSFFVTWSMARVYPAAEIGLPTYSWWICLFALGLTVLLSAERVTRGLLPLAALFKLSLVFPDEAPSRFSVAMKNNSTKKLERRMEEVRASGFPTDESEYAETMLDLVAGLSMHDRMTRGHSERVRAYTDMIAEEMKLTEEDAGKLRWAALLHDVGKIFVPSEILNKEGRPTESEWHALKSHTWKGDELIEPLKEFLGEWGLSVRNHHERWDGGGYPDGLSGSQIPLGARIVAVADAFDVMTSTRSYKEPRPASEARAEIAACAGAQFDPTVARAFLNIGLGRLRFAAGPLSWLANIQAATQLPVGTLAQPVFTVATAVAATVAAGAGPGAPAEIAFAEPPTQAPISTTAPSTSAPPTTQPPATNPPPPTTTPTTQPPTTVAPTTVAPTVPTPSLPPVAAPVAEASFLSTAEDVAASLVLVATTTDPAVFTIIGDLDNGDVVPQSDGFATAITPTNGTAELGVVFTPIRNFNGSAVVRYQACAAADTTACDEGTVTITVTPVNDLPTAVGDVAVALEDGSVTLTPAEVLANDTDADGDPMTVQWGVPANANSVISNGELTYFPTLNSTAPGSVPYQACDADGCGPTGFVTIEVTPVNDEPVAIADRIETAEDEVLELTDQLVLANDIEVDGDPLRVSWVPNPTLDLDASPPTFTPPQDFTGELDLAYQLCDPVSCVSTSVTVVVTPIEDPPIATGEVMPSLAEDSTFSTTEASVLANDYDPDGDPLAIVWGTPTPAGQFTANASGVVYDPPADFNGSVSIPYQVCDPGALCSAEVILELTFTAVDDPPVVSPASDPYVHVGAEDTTTNFTTSELLAVVSDVDTDVSSLSINYFDPGDGNFADNGDGSGFTYTPALDSTSDVSVGYEVCDLTTCVQGTITLTFAPQSDPPNPTTINLVLNEDSTTTISRATLESAANDPDTAGADLVFTFENTGLDKGHLDLAPATGPIGSVTFVADPDANGPEQARYTVCDDGVPDPNCELGIINFDITPQPDAPITTGAPTPKSTPVDTPVVLDEDYTFFDADGDTPIAQNFTSPDGAAVRLPDNSIQFTPAPGFSGQTFVAFDLCDATACTSDPQLSRWEITVVVLNSPSISDIGEQNVFVGVPVNAGPFPVDNPNATNLTYVHDLPPGLTLVEGIDEISIVGTITDPALLGTDIRSELTVTDDLGQSSTRAVFIKVGATGLSPFEGNVLITEVLAENMEWCLNETGNNRCVEAELIELLNISSSGIDLTDWSVQTFKPGNSQDGGDMRIEIGPDSTPAPGIELWDTYVDPGMGTVLHTRWLGGDSRPRDFTKLNRDKDHVWLLDGDGLVVDYMGWSTLTHLGHDHSDEYPEPELGIWNVADYGAMQHYAGEYSNSDYTSMSLATLNNANTAACWEFTTSGFASAGTYVCSEPDTFVTIEFNDIVPGHNAGMLMSFYYYNKFF